MAINRVDQNKLFELLMTPDREVQNFLTTLKAGDALRGRVIDIIPSENRAVINFKGYNLVADMPKSAPFSRGDVINVTVSQTGDKLMMKLSGDMAAAIGKGMELIPQGSAAPTQIATLLEGMKLPVNEQNIYISQKLNDYHLPVTKENVTEISNSLNRYLDIKGIDVRAFNIENAQLARDIGLAAMFMIDDTLTAATLGPTGQKEAAALSARMSNIFNAYNAAAGVDRQMNVRVSAGTVIFSAKGFQPADLSAAINNLAAQGLISGEDAGLAAQQLNSNPQSGTLSFNSNAAKITYSQASGLEAHFTYMNGMMSQFLTLPQQQSAALSAVQNMFDSGFERLNHQGTIEAPPQGNAIPANALDAKGAMMLEGIRQLYSTLKDAVTPGSVADVKQAVRDAVSNAIMLANNTKVFIKNFDSMKTGAAMDAGQARAELSKAASALKLMENAIAPFDGMATDKIDLKPAQLNSVFNSIKNFVDAGRDSGLFKAPTAVTITAAGFVAPDFDAESAIESLTFLKSRGLPLDRDVFTDIMTKYFKNDMKLNQNIENFSAAAAAPGLDDAAVSGIKTQIEGIRTLIEHISLSSSGDFLNALDMQEKIKRFVNDSGLNLEARLSAGTDPKELKENLKSMLINLGTEIQKIEHKGLTDAARHAVSRVEDSASDLLANLNAIQLINQRPVSFDMLYAQIPVFFNNKYFNGELQVWHRKGSLKDNLDNGIPVNLVFVLNTTNIGTVKINMTVFRNDLECNIKTDNEKAKQVLNRAKNDFFKGIDDTSYNLKAFNISVVDADEAGSSPESEGYVNLGKLNLQA